MTTETMIEWFDAYRIDHKVSYTNNRPAHVAPIGSLTISRNGNYCAVNGKRVSRKFVNALAAYYA